MFYCDNYIYIFTFLEATLLFKLQIITAIISIKFYQIRKLEKNRVTKKYIQRIHLKKNLNNKNFSCIIIALQNSIK